LNIEKTACCGDARTMAAVPKEKLTSVARNIYAPVTDAALITEHRAMITGFKNALFEK